MIGAPERPPAPIIVSALLAPQDFAWFDQLRRTHYPSARNLVPAHLTMFRHLPPSVEAELKQRLAEEARGPGPAARVAGLIGLDQGVAYRIDSPALEAIRARLADAFASLLTPQDAAPWQPHITAQNKVTPQAAQALLADLRTGFSPRPLGISGLAAWWYRDGAWELATRHAFRG